MPAAAVIPALATVAGPLIGKALGGTPTQTPSTPQDLQPMRAQQIGLLNYMLGMGPDPRTTTTPTAGALSTFNSGIQQAISAGPQHLKAFLAAHPHPDMTGGTTTVNPGMSVYSPAAPQTPTYGLAGSGIGGTTPLGQPHLAEGGTVYAKGGMVHGKGTHTSDSIPAKLSNGEGVLTAATVQHLGGPAIIAMLNHIGENRAAMAAGQPPRPMPPELHMALGGVAGAVGLGGGGNSTDMSSLGGLAGVVNKMNGGDTPTPTAARSDGGVTVNPVQVNQRAAPSIDVQPPSTPAVQPAGTGVSQTPQQRLETLYGPLGITPSGLQNQATNAYSQFLNQPSPSDRAANTTLPQLTQNLTGNSSTQGAINGLMGLQTGAGADVTGRLGQIGQGGGSQTGSSSLDNVLQQLGQGTSNSQGLLSQLANMFAGGQVGQVGGTGAINPTAEAALSGLAQTNPGQGIIQALQPSFQQNLAAADQTGGRFGTANALGRQQATNQFNVTAQQALQQGATQQQQAASSLGQLGNDANAQNLQAAIASAGNQLGGLNSAVNAAGQIGNQQLGATGQAINANQGLNSNILSALGQLGGFNLAGQGQQAQNYGTAGNLGLGQGQLGNQAASTIGNIAGQQQGNDLNAVNSAFGAGVTNTGQQNQGQQTAIQLINQLLGSAQGASIGGPVVSTPGLGTQEAQGIAGFLPYLAQILGNQGGQIPGSQLAGTSGVG